MTFTHQTAAPWEWSLEARKATRLARSDGDRWLLVTSGRAWLTQSGAGAYGDDVWLAAGERHRLPAGSEWVVEGSPAARVELLEAPELAAHRRLSPWHAWRRAAAPARQPA